MTFFINNLSFEKTIKDLTILQACEQNEIIVPRFCYHEKLSIAGNCRMCLVELEKSPKPVASCALPIMDNMKIFTDTLLVKKAREGILEFLLINHPLDCPICDWGGECDLQDQTQIFGGDRGRFYENKKSVSDKNCGPLIKTFMTRCIHCTRCVRFYSEVGGINKLGTTGRGGKMEISSYVLENLDSELSGNLIDLCPVGALTSKPSAFLGRPWDFESFKTIDILDGFGSNIQIDLSGLKLIRILPILNEFVNEDWITDKSRFFLDGLLMQRIQKPLVKVDNEKFLSVSWDFALDKIYKKFLFRNKFEKLVGIFGPLIDIETLLVFKKFLNVFESNFISFENNLYLKNQDFRQNFNFNFNKIKKSSYDLVFFLGLDLRKESSILNAKMRKFCIKNESISCAIGSNFDFNFNVKHLSNNFLDFFKILQGKHWFSNFFFNSKSILLLVGASFFFENFSTSGWSYFLKIQKILRKINLIELNLFFISPYISISNALELGMNLNFDNAYFNSKKIFYCLGVTQKFNLKKYGFHKNRDFFIYQGHHGNTNASLANIVLPTPTFIEKNSSFFSLQGFLEKTNKILLPFGDSRVDCEIFRYFGLKYNLFILKKISLTEFENFEYLNFFENKNYVLNFKNFYDLNKFLVLDKKIYLNHKISEPFFNNFYMTDPISEASLTLSLTANNFVFNKSNFKK